VVLVACFLIVVVVVVVVVDFEEMLFLLLVLTDVEHVGDMDLAFVIVVGRMIPSICLLFGRFAVSFHIFYEVEIHMVLFQC
jgi:hypothetical protein